MKHTNGISIILILCLFILPDCKKEYSCQNCSQPPFAIAGNDSTIALPTDSTLLNGSNSYDQDGKIVSWLWRMIKGPKSASITSPAENKTYAKFPDTGLFVFELKVTNDKGLSARDSIQILVVDPLQPNQPPIANAGIDQVITLPENAVLLNGTASSDPENKIAGFAWLKIAGPSAITLNYANKDTARAVGLVKGLYVFELTVTDSGGLFSKDTTLVEVKEQSEIPTVIACDSNSRPVITARLVPLGKLSKGRIMMNAVSVGNKILFAGGRWSVDCPDCWGSSRVDIYDTETLQWSTAELTEGRFGMASVVIGNKVFFAGGERGDGAFNNISSKVDIYDASTNTWTSASLSEPRSYIGAGTVGNKVIFAGGWQEDTDNSLPTSRIDIYDLSANQWTSTSLSESRGWISAVTANQRIYFAGGLNASKKPTNIIDVYDGVANSWSVSTLELPMSHAAGLAAGGNIYWASGCDVESKDFLGVPSQMSKLFTPGAWSVNDGHNAVIRNNKIIFFRNNSSKSNQFDIYDMTTGIWSVGALPADFNLHSTSIIGVNNRIYITGGMSPDPPYTRNDQVWLLEF